MAPRSIGDREVVMKTGIFIGVAALGFALFGVADAHSWWHSGPDINQRLSGSNFIVGFNEDTGQFTVLVSSIGKGPQGTAHHDVRNVVGPMGPDERCATPFGGDLSEVWVATFPDGSLLSGVTDEGQFVCTDGTVSEAHLTGTLTGGTGRFEGVSGTWEAERYGNGALATSTLTAEFD
jgi:hypothetical protein